MWHRIHRFLLNLETYILVVLFLSLILIAVLQIMLRNFFGGGMLWADSFVRIVVLWLTLLGAMVASRHTKHINIDILINWLPRSKARIARSVAASLTALTCLLMSWFSLDFVLQEYRYGGMAFAQVPYWVCEAIIPGAFFVISLRYTAAALMQWTRP